MTSSRRLLTSTATAVTLAAVLFVLSGGRDLSAQNRKDFSVVDPDSGHVALGLAIRKLNVSGTFMQAPAHPDDETNQLFALYTRGMGLRSVDLQNNRGEGGQNEIGPELFRDMGVLRTEELLSAHRIDGAEQFFTRAIDYGYSFDPQEVITKWGRDVIVGDYVRLIRTIRPDVILTMNIQGSGGDRAHEATTVLVRQAFRAAGDPSQYPDQIRDGLKPWQASKLYFAGGGAGGGRGAAPAGGGGPAGAAPAAGAGGRGRGGRGGGGRGAAGAPAAGGNADAGNQAPAAAPAAAPGGGAAPANTTHVARVDTGAYDALLGRTYTEIGNDARSNHKCQGVGGVPPLPGGGGRGGGGFGGPGGGAYTLMDTTIAGERDKDETSLFDGVDTSLAGIVRYAGDAPPAALTTGLSAIVTQAVRAKQAFDSGDDAGTAAPIEAGLTAIRALRASLGTMGLSDTARYEIDFRLKQKEQDYVDAVLAAHDLDFQALSDDGLVIAGQPVRLTLLGVNRGASDINVTDVTVSGFDNPAACTAATVKKDGVFTCNAAATVPTTARVSDPYFTDNYWKNPANPARNDFDPSVPFGVPFAPTPFHVTFHVKAGGVDVTKDVPVEYRYVESVYFGDKRMELAVEPAFSVTITPNLAIFPAAAAASAARPATRDLFVSVTNSTKGAAQATIALEVPNGWKVAPATAPVSFDKEDESRSARFVVTAPAGVKTGDYTARAVVTSPVTAAARFTSGYQAIEYPHIERAQVIKPSETSMKVIDVKVAANLNVGYIMGVGDQVPPAIEQLGAKLTLLGTDDLAWGDLAKYDVIVTGVRAYERREDLRAYNRRLIDYATAGGTVIVQYNKFEFNQAQYGPYPAVVGNPTIRITDENAPVKILVPNDPVFTFPNKIGSSAWDNWTQERGLYFLGQKDPKYVDLIAMTDPFPDNPGEKLGSLVEARVGKGRWVYLGLGLWRQLPAGTVGAYQLMANLISLPKAPPAAGAAAAKPATPARATGAKAPASK